MWLRIADAGVFSVQQMNMLVMGWIVSRVHRGLIPSVDTTTSGVVNAQGSQPSTLPHKSV